MQTPRLKRLLPRQNTVSSSVRYVCNSVIQVVQKISRRRLKQPPRKQQHQQQQQQLLNQLVDCEAEAAQLSQEGGTMKRGVNPATEWELIAIVILSIQTETAAAAACSCSSSLTATTSPSVSLPARRSRSVCCTLKYNGLSKQSRWIRLGGNSKTTGNHHLSLVQETFVFAHQQQTDPTMTYGCVHADLLENSCSLNKRPGNKPVNKPIGTFEIDLDELLAVRTCDLVHQWAAVQPSEFLVHYAVHRLEVTSTDSLKALEVLAGSSTSLNDTDHLDQFGHLFSSLWYAIPEAIILDGNVC